MQRLDCRAVRVGGLRGDMGIANRSRRESRPRRARMLALFSATIMAVPVLSSSGFAQTWVNPNTGFWSNSANWTPATPGSGSSTQVTFNASGSETYTASQDLASPFVLNSITFNNAGTGLITIDQNPLSFSGASPTIVQSGTGRAQINNQLQLAANTSLTGSGTGTVTLAGPMFSAPVATGTSGSSFINNSASAPLVLQNGTTGGNLYSLRLNTGSTFVTSGGYTLSSTQRGNDPFESVNDGGFWSFIVGNTAGQTANFTMTGGGLVGQNAMIGNVAGSNGIATFSGAGTSATFTGAQGRFGTNAGNGTINILGGATVSARRGDLVRNAGGSGYLQVDGAGSKFTASQELNVPLSSGNATLNVSNGGTVSLVNADLFLASAVDSSFNAVSSNASATVTGAGSGITASGDGISTGVILVGFGAAAVSANGTLTVSNGGTINATGAYIGRGAGTGTVIVDGSASQLNNSFQFVIGSSTASSLNLTNGGKWTNTGDTFAASNSTDRAIINVSGASALANLTGVLVLSGAGSSTLNINSGGELRVGTLFASDGAGGLSNTFVNGANAKLSLTNQAVLGDADVATANVTVSGGANMNVNSAAFLSPAVGATSNVNITGGGSTYTSTGAATELHIGGNGVTAGGTANFSVSAGASATVTGPAIVYPRGTLKVGAGVLGGAFTSASNTVNGTVQFEAGTFNTTGALTVAGQVLLSSAARNAAGTASNKKMVEAGSATLTSSGVIDLNDNDALFHDNNKAKYENFVKLARNNGLWNQPGITSTAAKNAVPANTNLGVLSGAEYLAANGAPFNGKTVVVSDVLIKYTFNGDTDLNGVVNFDDYSRVDSGFNNGRSGWLNGDFDYNGVVNFDDYSLIDQGFNTQGATVLSTGIGGLAGPGDRPLMEAPLPTDLIRAGIAPTPIEPDVRHSTLNAVPEPSFLGAASFVLFAASRRRRVRREIDGSLRLR